MDVHPTKNVSIGIDPLPCLDGCGGGDPKESLSGLGVPLAHRGLWPGDEAQEGHGDFHRTTDCWHVLWQTAGPFG